MEVRDGEIEEGQGECPRGDLAERGSVMSKFRKKPVVIEAYQLTEEMFWRNKYLGEYKHQNWCGSYNQRNGSFDMYLHIPSLEGVMRGQVGDWIITGVKGEVYPCKPEIFEMTYEPEQ